MHIAADSLVEGFGGYAIEKSQIVVDHNLLAANNVDAPLDGSTLHNRGPATGARFFLSFHVKGSSGRSGVVSARMDHGACP